MLFRSKKSAAKTVIAAPPPEKIIPPLAPPADNLVLLEDMEVKVVLELGRHRVTLDEALDLGEHSLIELDRRADQPIDILVNGKLFARGEVVTVGEHFGVRLTEIIGQV